jgi:hypothetical protein
VADAAEKPLPDPQEWREEGPPFVGVVKVRFERPHGGTLATSSMPARFVAVAIAGGCLMALQHPGRDLGFLRESAAIGERPCAFVGACECGWR